MVSMKCPRCGSDNLRGYINDVCTIDRDILDKTLEFGKEEWIVSSNSATGIPNVPIFIKADNTEQVLYEFLGR